MLFYLCMGRGKYNFSSELLPYSLGFGISYGMATVGTVLAVTVGSVSLTSLVVSYSLIVPTLYGIIFLGDETSIMLYLGLVALMISLFLINYKKEKNEINYKWIIFVFIAFVGNAGCTISQKLHQIILGTGYKTEFMILSMFFVVIISLTFVLIKERKTMVFATKQGGIYAFLYGVLNACTNLFVMILNDRINASIMFPIISAGGIIASYFLAVFFYKEKLSMIQHFGLVLGVLSVVLLNI